MPVNNWNGSLGQTSRLYRAQPVPALIRQRINDEEAARAQRMRARTGQAPLPMVPGQQVQGPQPVSGSPPLRNMMGRNVTRDQMFTYNRDLLAARARGETLPFETWRQRQKGMMGFDYSQYDGSPSSQLRMRQDLDNVRLNEMVGAVTEDPNSMGYANNMAQIYERMGRTDEAAKWREQARAMQTMAAEQGYKQQEQERAAAQDTAKRQAEMARYAREAEIEQQKVQAQIQDQQARIQLERDKLAAETAQGQATAQTQQRQARVDAAQKRLDAMNKQYIELIKERGRLAEAMSQPVEDGKTRDDTATASALADLNIQLRRLGEEMRTVTSDISYLTQPRENRTARPADAPTVMPAPEQITRGTIIENKANGKRYRATANGWEPMDG